MRKNRLKKAKTLEVAGNKGKDIPTPGIKKLDPAEKAKKAKATQEAVAKMMEGLGEGIGAMFARPAMAYSPKKRGEI